jgi:hypothetical protein
MNKTLMTKAVMEQKRCWTGTSSSGCSRKNQFFRPGRRSYGLRVKHNSYLEHAITSREGWQAEQDAKGSDGRHHCQWMKDTGEAMLLGVCLDIDKGGEVLLWM